MKLGFCFSWLRLALLAIPAGAWGAPTIEFVSPAPASQAGENLLVRVRLRLNGEPFTEGGANRWCQIDIRNRLGRTVAQAVLRDNGRDFDSKPSDGEWTAPVQLRLPAGSYSIQVTVNSGTERFSRHCEFAVTPASTTVPRPSLEPDPLPVIKEELGRLTAAVHALGSNRGFPAAAWISMLALGVAGLTVGLTLRGRPMKQPLQPPVSLWDIPPAPEANWKPLFGCLDGIQSAVSSIKGEVRSRYKLQGGGLDEWMRWEWGLV
jgi:hypothetical protein